MEHQIWEQLLDEEAVSAVKALQVASQEGQTLHTLTDAAGFTAWRNLTTVSAEVQNDVGQCVEADDCHAVAPTHPIQRYEWNGAGYILFDANTGEGQFLIEGALSGGVSVGGGSGVNPDCGLGESSWCAGGDLSLTDLIIEIILSVVSDPVNLSNGNFMESAIDLTVPARGQGVLFSRWYNSQSERMGRLGYGWIDNLDVQLFEHPDGSITYIDEDGTEHQFLQQLDGSYTSPPGLHVELVQTTAGYALTHKDGLVYSFDMGGRLLAQTDRNGNRTTLNYDAVDRLESVTGPEGRTLLIFTYTSDNRIATVTDLAGRQVHYGYDEDGNLVTATNVLGQTWTYGYYTDHNFASRTLPEGHTDRFYYDDRDRMVRHVDALGNAETFSYDRYNGRAVLTDARGADTVYTLDARGRATSRTDALGNRVENQWDPDNNAAGTWDSSGYTTTITYDDQGNVLSYVDAIGVQKQYSYNDFGGVETKTEIVNGEVISKVNIYDDRGNPVERRDAEGNITQFTVDEHGQVVGQHDLATSAQTTLAYENGLPGSQTTYVTDAETGDLIPLTTELHFTAAGQLASMEDPDGNETTLTPDNLGRPTMLQMPGRGAYTMSFDSRSQPTAITDTVAGVLLTHFTYDAVGNLIESEDAAGHVQRWEYDAAGNAVRSIDAFGNATNYVYDEIGRVASVTYADGTTVSYGYCGDGDDPTVMVDGNGNIVQREVDAAGRLMTVTDPLGNRMHFSYDERNRLVAQTDPEDHVTRYAYDGNDRLVAVTDARGKVTRYEYGTNCCGASPSRMIDANDHVWTYEHDELGRQIGEIDPLGNAWRYGYNGAGDLAWMVDANGNRTEYDYHAPGLVAAIRYADGSGDNFAYDARGTLTRMWNADSDYSFVYDQLRRLATYTDEVLEKTVSHTYDLLGRRATMTDGEGVVTRYHYDTQGRMTGIEDGEIGLTRYAYDAMGRRAQMIHPNGIVTAYDYDAAGRLTALAARDSAQNRVSAYRYTYDRTGMRRSVTDLEGTTKHDYDELYQLTNVVYADGKTQAFTYDNVGNRLILDESGTVTTYEYDAGNRLLAAEQDEETITWQYDDNGNTVTEQNALGQVQFVYDLADRLTNIVSETGKAISFGYDPRGLRVFESQDGETTRFLLTADHVLGACNISARTSGRCLPGVDSVLADHDVAGELQSRYVHGSRIDEIVATVQESGSTYFHTDALGSATHFTGVDQSTAGTKSYDVFGSAVESSGSYISRFGFTGREEVGRTDVLYYRARFYKGSIGRFLNRDPFRGALVVPEAFHDYIYVNSSPSNYLDPQGLIVGVVIIIGVIMFIGGALILENALESERRDTVADLIAMIAITMMFTGMIFVMWGLFMPQMAGLIAKHLGWKMSLAIVGCIKASSGILLSPSQDRSVFDYAWAGLVCVARFFFPK